MASPAPGYAELITAVGDGDADRTINGLRCDIAFVRRNGWPMMIVEVHGAGHFGRSNRKRRVVEFNDAIKRHVCKIAGVRLVELRGEVTGNSAYAELRRAGLGYHEFKQRLH